jgi:hypothetical protein
VGREDYLGDSVDAAGDVVIAGAYREDTYTNYTGAAYIYERNAGGVNSWNEVKKLTPSDAEYLDFFGISVAVDGDVAVGGAYLEDTVDLNAGAAYIFERNWGGTNNWGEVKKLTASDGMGGDYFGNSVSVAGDVVVVGASNADIGGDINAGAAYIFERNKDGADTWGEVKKLIASNLDTGDKFGTAVAVGGDVAVVGAPAEDTGGTGAGAAYIFERNIGGTDTWGQVKMLKASDVFKGDNFGDSVAVEGDVVIVGTRYQDSAATNAGAAYIFMRNAGGTNNWGEVKKLVASDAELGDYFGWAVAVDGDVAVVGAYNEDSGGRNAGAAYVFKRNENGINAWGEVKKLTALQPGGTNEFGKAVAVAGDVLIAGAPKFADSGAVYVFEHFMFTAPMVKNDGAADITETSAVLRGKVLCSGCDVADVKIFWGDEDGGQATSAWDHVIEMGVQSGPFSDSITGLESNKTYYYCCYATNSLGATWAAMSTNFTTLSRPSIATNALVFPSAGTVFTVPVLTNITWDSEKITDEIDGTFLTITEISVHQADTTNKVATVASNRWNFLGNTPWVVSEELFGSTTSYVVRFEVVDSSSLTNSRIFWDNMFYAMLIPPHIQTNALLFPSADAVLAASFQTNITWDFMKITDDIDGTNLTITEISVHILETSNKVAVVTNDISNLPGEIPWLVPPELFSWEADYVLRFEVVDSTSVTNSRIFRDNPFIIIPEPVSGVLGMIALGMVVAKGRWGEGVMGRRRENNG